MTSGYYARLRESREDDEFLAAYIDRVVKQLEDTSTSGDRPGMLLGKIQSGKTRAFVGVIARAFDRGFDVAVVFTKGTKTLSAQTVARLGHDLREFIDEDEVMVIDIMKQPGKLAKSEQRRKLVIVAKKQSQNLDRILQFFDTDYLDLKHKRVLIVDDEADLASVRFVRKKDQPDVEQGKIADKMDALRSQLSRRRRALPEETSITIKDAVRLKLPALIFAFCSPRSKMASGEVFMRSESGMRFDHCIGLQERDGLNGTVFDANVLTCDDKPLGAGESILVGGRAYR
jgi:hypothetical protein